MPDSADAAESRMGSNMASRELPAILVSVSYLWRGSRLSARLAWPNSTKCKCEASQLVESSASNGAHQRVRCFPTRLGQQRTRSMNFDNSHVGRARARTQTTYPLDLPWHRAPGQCEEARTPSAQAILCCAFWLYAILSSYLHLHKSKLSEFLLHNQLPFPSHTRDSPCSPGRTTFPSAASCRPSSGPLVGPWRRR